MGLQWPDAYEGLRTRKGGKAQMPEGLRSEGLKGLKGSRKRLLRPWS